MPIRMGVLMTHPIQYQVPWLRALAARPEVDLTAFYCMLPDSRQQGAGFDVAFQWDVPLLEGYRYEVLENVAARPSVVSFDGCDTPSLGSVLRARGFDVFVANGWVAKSCLQALWACRRQGVPCLVRAESNALRPRPWWVRMAHRLLLRQYAAFLAIGRSNRRFYASNGVAEERMFDVPYCVDNEWFGRESRALEPRRAEIRRQWSVAEDARVFLFCGKLIPKKRPLDLLQALALAQRPHGPRLHVVVAGDGPLRDDCEAFARGRGLNVSFVGFLNQTRVPQAYVAADCLVLPSDDGETWGLVVNEAMACGLPAIVSDRVGCHPDLVVPGRTGAVFPLGDVRALAAHLDAVASDPALSRQMGDNARDHVAAYSVGRAVAGTLQALDFALAARPAPA